MNVVSRHTVESTSEAFASVDGSTVNHAHFVEKSSLKESCIDVTATHNAYSPRAKLRIEKLQSLGKIYAVFTYSNTI
jgi:hypothetical protein